MKLIRKLEEKITRGVLGAARNVTNESGDSEALELKAAILDAVEREVPTLGHNQSEFPFPHISVEFAVRDAASQAILDVAFRRDSRLEKMVRKRLLKIGSSPPAGLVVRIGYLSPSDPSLDGRPFRIDFAPMAPGAAPLGRTVRFVVKNGRCSGRETYEMVTLRVSVGRLPEVVDINNRVIRCNDLVFPEHLDPSNPTVSRLHAHIDFDPRTGDFRVFDDASRAGTRVVRQSRTLPVPAGATGGVRLHDSDEIYFGAVCVRLEISDLGRHRGSQQTA